MDAALTQLGALDERPLALQYVLTPAPALFERLSRLFRASEARLERARLRERGDPGLRSGVAAQELKGALAVTAPAPVLRRAPRGWPELRRLLRPGRNPPRGVRRREPAGRALHAPVRLGASPRPVAAAQRWRSAALLASRRAFLARARGVVAASAPDAQAARSRPLAASPGTGIWLGEPGRGACPPTRRARAGRHSPRGPGRRARPDRRPGHRQDRGDVPDRGERRARPRLRPDRARPEVRPRRQGAVGDPAERTVHYLDFEAPEIGINPLLAPGDPAMVADKVVEAFKDIHEDGDIRTSSDRFLRQAAHAAIGVTCRERFGECPAWLLPPRKTGPENCNERSTGRPSPIPGDASTRSTTRSTAGTSWSGRGGRCATVARPASTGRPSSRSSATALPGCSTSSRRTSAPAATACSPRAGPSFRSPVRRSDGRCRSRRSATRSGRVAHAAQAAARVRGAGRATARRVRRRRGRPRPPRCRS